MSLDSLVQSTPKYYSQSFKPAVLIKLQRIFPGFLIYKNEQTQKLDAVLPIKDVKEFEEKAAKVYKKLGIDCLYVHGENPQLIIPGVNEYYQLQKINAAKIGAQQEIDRATFNLLKEELARSTELTKPVKSDILVNDLVSRFTLSLPVGFEIQAGSHTFIQYTFLVTCRQETPNNAHAAYLLAKTIEGQTAVFSINKPDYLSALFLSAEALYERTFQNQGQSNPIPWGSLPVCLVYSNPVSMYYLDMINVITADLVHQINQDQSRQQQAQDHGALVFSFGCGEAKDLIAAKGSVCQEGIAFEGVGFDINSNNFPTQKAENIKLLKGDVLQLGRLMAPYQSRQALKIGIFGGILAHQCLQGTAQAVSVLQQGMRCLDIAFIYGFTNVLVTKSICQAMGWQVRAKPSFIIDDEKKSRTEKSYYFISKMPSDVRKAYLIKRGKKRSSNHIFDCLDLSFSADPLSDLQLFDDADLTLIKQIDLSWSWLDIEELQKLFARFDALGKIKLNIIISGTERWLDDCDLIKVTGTYSLVERTDFIPNEVNVFAPDEARSLGIYERLPSKLHEKDRLKQTARISSEEVFTLLEALLTQLTEVPSTAPPFTFSSLFDIATLKWPKGRNVKQMSLFMPMQRTESDPLTELRSLLGVPPEDPFVPGLSGARLVVSYADGLKKVYEFNNKALLSKFSGKLITYGYNEVLLDKLPDELAMDWDKTPIAFTYEATPNILTFYQNFHHRYLPHKLFATLVQKGWLGKAKQQGVTLFSFGCGEANELRLTLPHLRKQGVECSGIGIDLNPRNFPAIREEGVTLVEGDMFHSARLIKPFLLENESSLKIGLLIGSLSRQCLPRGLIDAVDLLQQLITMDMMLLSGATADPHIPKWIAKGIGWQFEGGSINQNMDEEGSKKSSVDTYNVYMITKMNDHDRKRYLIHRGSKRTIKGAFHCLDLSLSADPLRDINLFNKEELKDIKQIDLSWSAMNENDAKIFAQRICDLDRKDLKFIVSGKELWFAHMPELKQFQLYERLDHLPDQVPFLPPDKARLLGLYDSLPAKKITR
ncbi:MAG: hypothetical protein ACHQJ6_08340 [Candidatus Berkiellales bacterium]